MDLLIEDNKLLLFDWNYHEGKHRHKVIDKVIALTMIAQ